MKPWRRLVRRGRRCYVLCRTIGRPKRLHAPARRDRRTFAWLPAVTLLVVIAALTLAGASRNLAPRDPREGLPIASVQRYSFDDFANAQRNALW